MNCTKNMEIQDIGNETIGWVHGNTLEILYQAHDWSDIMEPLIFFIPLLRAWHNDLYKVARQADPKLYLSISVKFYKNGNHSKWTLFCDVFGIRIQKINFIM